MDVKIRVANEMDAKELLEIYGYYVKNTAISFEYEAPSLEEFTERIRNTLKAYPYLVAEVDGKARGYAYAGRFHTRDAFAWSAETSIYLSKDCHRMGLGKLLYEKLEAILKAQNVVNVYAVVAVPATEGDRYVDRNSERFHEALGYKTVSTLHCVGSKFGNWYDLLEMEKFLGAHDAPPKPFLPFPQICATGDGSPWHVSATGDGSPWHVSATGDGSPWHI